MKFDYIERENIALGKILKPITEMEIFSKDGLWYGLDDVLVDTGADISLIPKSAGEEIVGDIKSGIKASMKGILPAGIEVFIHELRIKVAGREFVAKVAIADTNEVPALLGRFGALDIFRAEFIKGKEFILE